MANGTKQQWLNLSQQLRENTTPRELGEAVLALAQAKRARQPRWPKLSNHITIVLGSACVLLISGWGWTNNQLASRLQDSLDNEKVLIADLRESLDRETQLRLAAETARAEAVLSRQRVGEVALGLHERAQSMWKAGNYDQSLATMRSAEDSDEKAIIGLRVIRDDLYDGNLERMQADLDKIGEDQQ